MKEKEPFYLHPPPGEKLGRRREGRQSVRQSVREGVRFSQHSHKTRDTQDRHRRDRERYRDKERDKERERSEKAGRRPEKEEVKTGRRSQSVEESNNVRQTDRRRRTMEVETRRQDYYERRLTSSRSKSHDESERSERRERGKRASEDGPQPAPFYLHSSVGQQSSSQAPASHNNGYERIQSLFYESLDNLDTSQHIESNKKTRRRSREFSPEKKGFDLQYKDSNNNNSSKYYSQNERRKSPKRRAAPQMPLPPIDYKGF